MSAEPVFFIATLAGFVLAVVIVGAVIVGVTRALFGRSRRLEAELGVEVLDARLAQGEITRENYAIARRALGR